MKKKEPEVSSRFFVLLQFLNIDFQLTLFSEYPVLNYDSCHTLFAQSFSHSVDIYPVPS